MSRVQVLLIPANLSGFLPFMSWGTFCPKLHRTRCMILINSTRNNSELLLQKIRCKNTPVTYTSMKYPSLARLVTKIGIETKFFANFQKYLKQHEKIDLKQVSRKLTLNEQQMLVETIENISREQLVKFVYSSVDSGTTKFADNPSAADRLPNRVQQPFPKGLPSRQKVPQIALD